MDEKEIDSLNRSRQAVIAMDLFKPFLDKEKEAVLTRLKQEFRANKHELSVYIGLVSTLVSLDDLEQKILRTIKAGSKVGEKVVLNGRE